MLIFQDLFQDLENEAFVSFLRTLYYCYTISGLATRIFEHCGIKFYIFDLYLLDIVAVVL